LVGFLTSGGSNLDNYRKFTPGGTNPANGFESLGVGVERLFVVVRGAHVECAQELRSAYRGVLEKGHRGPVRVAAVPWPIVYLDARWPYEHDQFDLWLNGREASLEKTGGEWMLRLNAGPAAPDGLAELGAEIRGICGALLCEGSQAEIGCFSTVLRYRADVPWRRMDRRGSAILPYYKGRYVLREEEVDIGTIYASERGGMQVEFFEEAAKPGVPGRRDSRAGSAFGTAGKEEGPVHGLELFFYNRSIRQVTCACSKDGHGSPITLPDLPFLAGELVRAALGGGPRPPFFRVVSEEPRGLDVALRPDSSLWKSIRGAFLQEVAGPGPAGEPGQGIWPLEGSIRADRNRKRPDHPGR
jgi:hypothetical protein